MNCPKCQGPTFDNTAENAQRKARGEKLRPDYKCRDKNCDGVIWPPKGPAASRPAAAPQAKQGYSSGGHIPEIDGPDAEHPLLPHERLDKLFALHKACYAQAYHVVSETFEDTPSQVAVSAVAATLYISAKDMGLHVAA